MHLHWHTEWLMRLLPYVPKILKVLWDWAQEQKKSPILVYVYKKLSYSFPFSALQAATL